MSFPFLSRSASSLRTLRHGARLALMALGLGLAGTTTAQAQSASPNQPLAIQGLPPAPCPLLLPHSDHALQPLRIQPSQVARKNAIGCLSPADAAVYGPDGCPVKLCTAEQGIMPLPQR
ncbi:MAG: hypothetical protein ACKO0M_11495 [Cyanobium sp.]